MGMRTVAAAFVLMLGSPAAAADAGAPDSAKISISFDKRIVLRDGVTLNTIVYRPKNQTKPGPCILTMTPYTADTYHNRGVYFAAHGLTFITANVRGRDESGGTFRPNIQEKDDGYDAVEWLARQPWCNGKIGMWGGSYAGHSQWATARARPPHLATIVPVASPYMGADFPYRNNIGINYLLQWIVFTSGNAAQNNIFADGAYWNRLWRDRFEKGEAFITLDRALGDDRPVLREWLQHPEVDSFYDQHNPSAADYAAMKLPILTITGAYDGDQPGAIAHYRNFMAAASPQQRAQHFLIIGPWDHAATRTPRANIGGLQFGPASLVDLPQLHTEWYNWTMADGAKPTFLKKQVAYYVMGAEKWRYADSLEAVTAQSKPFFLDSTANANHLLSSGSLSPSGPGRGVPDRYVHDPRDVSLAGLEEAVDASSLVDQRMLIALDGKQLVYHSAPFTKATELSGFFKLSAWITIDQPDTDFQASVYELTPDGQNILLTTDILRARYRESLRAAKLVTERTALRYDFDRFTFVSRELAAGSRLRLVIGPINSIAVEKNYNSAKPVAEQTMADARTVTVDLVHDGQHPSALYVPFAQP